MLPKDTFSGLYLKRSRMPAPWSPAGKLRSDPTFEPVIEVGSTTVIVFATVCVPTVSVIVADAARSGAVQTNVLPLAPVTGSPASAAHVPALLPLNATCSPTAIVVRAFELLSEALNVVLDVIVGAFGGLAILAFVPEPEPHGQRVSTGEPAGAGASCCSPSASAPSSSSSSSSSGSKPPVSTSGPS